eukprot:TRINITY_DN9865_c0_g1_i1.p1 TRINITY_DN9865_c0_g1~~TRINITY_DN9865_c0_g1_i1.p1  ORF type:complete len:149 (+),score=23.27 TRINITY_DN9865_c0_g1_i1:198-644(+)
MDVVEDVDADSSMVENSGYHGTDDDDSTEAHTYKHTKRPPMRLHRGKGDIYVSRSSSQAALYKRACKLLNECDLTKGITLHGLGAAIQCTVDLALTMQRRHYGQLCVRTTTSTVPLIDDLTPDNESDDAFASLRFNSAVHINIRKLNK